MVSTKTRMILDSEVADDHSEAPQGRFKREATRGSVLRLFGGLSVAVRLEAEPDAPHRVLRSVVCS
jgi:hypothetical protein